MGIKMIIDDKRKEFVVEGYVLKEDKLLLVFHKKMGMWFPPGGHINANELPEDALKREIKEETGLDVSVESTLKYSNDFNVEILGMPHHIQVENIKDDHYHIDLVYVCRPMGGKLMKNEESDTIGFFSLDEINSMDKLPDDVRYFSKLILKNDILVKQKLPVLSSLVDGNQVNLSGISLIVVQHLKKNTIGFIELMKKAGFRDMVLIGKPYSMDEEAISEMKKLCTVITPSFADLESLKAVEQAVAQVSNPDRLIGFDLGGYLSRYFEGKDTKHTPICIIEDTKNGIWFDSNVKLGFPLFSVANSYLKSYAENHFVAKAVLRNAEYIIVNGMQQSLNNKNILVLGYGSVGESVARTLKLDSSVAVHDKNYIRLLKGKIDGFTIVDKLTDLGDFDVVVGTTGDFVLNAQHLLNLKNNAILINGSTRKREFDIDSVKGHIKRIEQLNGITKYYFDNDKSVYLVANGYPVNFSGSESVPEYVLDMVFSEIFVLAQTAVRDGASPGFYPMELFYKEEENAIARLWLEKYG